MSTYGIGEVYFQMHRTKVGRHLPARTNTVNSDCYLTEIGSRTNQHHYISPKLIRSHSTNHSISVGRDRDIWTPRNCQERSARHQGPVRRNALCMKCDRNITATPSSTTLKKPAVVSAEIGPLTQCKFWPVLSRSPNTMTARTRERWSMISMLGRRLSTYCTLVKIMTTKKTTRTHMTLSNTTTVTRRKVFNSNISTSFKIHRTMMSKTPLYMTTDLITATRVARFSSYQPLLNFPLYNKVFL